jgi:hypothetical protein
MGTVPKPSAVIRNFVQPDPDHTSKKSQSGPISNSVRIRYSGIGISDHSQLLYFRHESGFSLPVQCPPGYMNTPLSFLPMKRKGV